MYARSSLRLLVAAALAAPLVPAGAQVLEEVIVTAQKRDESIQDVGIAISAFTGDQLKTLGVEDSFDIAAFVPGVHISGALAGQNSQFTIRGVTQTDFNDIVEAPNAVYLDEGYIAVAQAQTFALFDIERVEILKGPQGTLFGRNATGGLVQYISRKPSTEEIGRLRRRDLRPVRHRRGRRTPMRVEAAISGPLTDRLSARVAGLYNDQDPYLKNLYREDYGQPVRCRHLRRPDNTGQCPGRGCGRGSGGQRNQGAARHLPVRGQRRTALHGDAATGPRATWRPDPISPSRRRRSTTAARRTPPCRSTG